MICVRLKVELKAHTGDWTTQLAVEFPMDEFNEGKLAELFLLLSQEIRKKLEYDIEADTP